MSTASNSRQSILVIDDDARIVSLLRRALSYEGYTVRTALTATAGLASARDEPPNLVVLDLMLPDLDGFSLCRQLRADEHSMPVLMLTARDAIEDRVAGLDSGADDYLVKPFDPRELLARVRALLRREPVRRDPVLRIADIELDTATHEVRRGRRAIELTTREYAILELFVRNANRVLSRDEIAQHIWAFDFTVMSNVIDVYVGNLRRKLGDDADPRLLRTVRGSGYLLRDSSHS